MLALVYGFIHVAHSGWANAETYIVFPLAVVLLVGFGLFEAFVARDPMMPMRIFENRNRSGSYLVMLIIGAGMFALFYFMTFFVQGVLEYSPLKSGFAFVPIAVVIGVMSQVASKLLPKAGPKPIIVGGTLVLIFAMFWLSRVSAHSGYANTILPGVIVLAVAMGLLFVPLTVTAVSKVANTDAGLASALLNVGQQVGGTIGLSVLATVFQTSANNWGKDHQAALHAKVQALGSDLAPVVGQRLAKAGSNGLQPEDVSKFVKSLPGAQQARALQFFTGPYAQFSRELQAHASGTAFFGGVIFAVAGLLVALFVINAKKTDLPAGDGAAPVLA